MPEPDAFEPVLLGAGEAVEGRWYAAPGARAAAVLFGGIGGGFDTPAGSLYLRLGRHLPTDAIAVLRVRFRRPGDLRACVEDVLAGMDWLAGRGLERLGLVGHSFGGAVAIAAGSRRPAVTRAVVTLSTQGAGTDGIARLRDVPVLIVHGRQDEVLPPTCSVALFQQAGPRSRLHFLPEAGHVLDEAADEVFRLVQAWLVGHLAEAGG